MSFSKQVKQELNSIQIKGNCCKRAYLFGVLLSAEKKDEGIFLKISDTDSAEKVVALLNTIYKCEPVVKKIRRGCFESTEIYFKSKKASDFIDFADRFDEGSHMDSFFTCKGCGSAFLRGAFCAVGSVSDPQKSYTLEMRIKNMQRAETERNKTCHLLQIQRTNLPILSLKRSAVCWPKLQASYV